MARTLRKSKGRNPAGTFAALPHVVMDSEDFRSLSGGALKVLLGLLRQYRGVNNGDLSATFASASEWGIGSKATLAKALEELQERNLIIRTREGRFIKPGGCCALYALTWRLIDPCDGKIEVSPTTAPPRKFSLERAKHPVQKLYRQGTETVPMEG
ncbi:hypothetical protein [Pseudomonas aeruginosa]|uniref:hypothetical protein n=1 Tax=Pseudomonas aeruginosa TaxID=287 RepID=UPI002E2A8F12|nr:hypothetical protein [Pseudomonas aeruginosa]